MYSTLCVGVNVTYKGFHSGLGGIPVCICREFHSIMIYFDPSIPHVWFYRTLLNLVGGLRSGRVHGANVADRGKGRSAMRVVMTRLELTWGMLIRLSQSYCPL